MDTLNIKKLEHCCTCNDLFANTVWLGASYHFGWECPALLQDGITRSLVSFNELDADIGARTPAHLAAPLNTITRNIDDHAVTQAIAILKS